MISDSEFLNFFRRKPEGKITQRDIDLSGDVFTLQPLLYFLAYSIQAKTMVEIGTADGSTTIPLLKAAEENGGVVYSVDPSSCEDCKRLVYDYGYIPFWKFNQMKSDEFFKMFNQKIDLAFVDGEHSGQGVYNDVCNIIPLLSDKGILFVSDFDNESFPNCPNDPNQELVEPNYEIACSNGIYKGLRAAMKKFPEYGTVMVWARENPSVLISKAFNAKEIKASL